jgi:protein TonB
MTGSTPDVYTLDEIARAVGVPAETVRAAVTSGELLPWRDSYFAERDVLRLVSTLRSVAVVSRPLEPPRGLFIEQPATAGRGRFPLLASVGAHVMLLGVALWLTAGAPQTAPSPVTPEPPRLVFLSLPGVGGGGGGSGAKQKKPAARLERASGLKASVSAPPAVLTRNDSNTATEPPSTPATPVPTLVEKAPEPLPSRAVVAPIVVTASQSRDRIGVVEPAPAEVSREGTGTGGRAGGGQGQGIGDGVGSGLGEGSGGGTGGGPYRAGSGIQPPRLLREVKADYTEEARRKRVSGDVLLEIVVTRDGRVGNVSVLRGLGQGLDQQAIAAVRQWQFAPARRQGEPVDVIVEVAVEFKLR